MNKTTYKHTPGPWAAKYDEYGDELWFGGDNCGTWTIGPCYLGGDGETEEGREQMKVNANLIAAAPELLEALENLYEDVIKEVSAQGPGYSKENLLCLKVFSDAREAIAKAKGQS